jgi:hypothetical protein
MTVVLIFSSKKLVEFCAAGTWAPLFSLRRDCGQAVKKYWKVVVSVFLLSTAFQCGREAIFMGCPHETLNIDFWL